MLPIFISLWLAFLPYALSFSLSVTHAGSLTPIIPKPPVFDGLASTTHDCLTRKTHEECEVSGRDEPEVLDGVTAADGAVNGIQRCIWCKGRHASRCFSVWR
jgi:hypothetical protein